jgi:16S rRNA processing protein RimM
MEKFKIGKIVNTFGLKGELKVLPEQNFENNFKNINKFWIKGYDNTFICEKISIKNGQFIKLKIKGYDDINEVLQFKNKDIYIDSFKEVELEDGEYLTEDLIGSKIYQKGEEIAIITEVENFGATDILVLDMAGKEARVPFVSEFFSKIEPKQKTLAITERFFEGLVL